MKSLVATAILLVCEAAWASDWSEVNLPINGNSYEFDRSGIVKHGSKVRVWTRRSFTEPRPAPGYEKITYHGVLVHHEIDCKERLTTMLEAFFLADPDKTRLPFAFSTSKPEAIVPDTPDEALFNRVCK